MLNIFIVSYSYIAALIGAGFASGQEILCYFNSFGKLGLYSIILSGIIFSLFAFSVLAICVKYKINSYDSFLCVICGKKMKRVLIYTSGVFSFAVFSVMLSAIGEIGKILTNLPAGLCAAFVSITCALIFCLGIKRTLDINGFIGLLLTAGIITCCFYILRYRDHHVFSDQALAYSSAAIYSGYNLIPAAPVLVTLSRHLKKNTDAVASSLISGSALMLVTVLIFAILEIYSGKIPLGEFPMLTIAARQGVLFKYIYLILFSSAAITTLLSSGAAVTEIFSLNRSKIWLFVSAGYLAAGAGFGTLINTAYRICGILGLFLSIYIIIKCVRIITSRNKI